MKDKITIIVFGVFLGIVFIGYTFTKDRNFSTMENKNLIGSVGLTEYSIMEGELSENLYTYMRDQVPFRDNLVLLSNDTQNVLAGDCINDVYIGEDGYLLKNFQAPGDIYDANIEAVTSLCNDIKDAEIIVEIVPTSTYVYEDKLPKHVSVYNESDVIEDATNKLVDTEASIIDVSASLTAHKDEDIYFKTDSHWTMDGAYYGYADICKGLGIEPTDRKKLSKTVGSDSFLGDLYSMAPIDNQADDDLVMYINSSGEYKVDYIDDGARAVSMMNIESLKLKDKYKVFLDGKHSRVRIASNSENAEKILVIKDSYGNSLVPFLADNYNEVNVIDMRYYTDSISEFVKTNGIKKVVVICGIDTLTTDESIKDIK